ETPRTAHQGQGDDVDADGADSTPVRPETTRTGRTAHQRDDVDGADGTPGRRRGRCGRAGRHTRETTRTAHQGDDADGVDGPDGTPGRRRGVADGTPGRRATSGRQRHNADNQWRTLLGSAIAHQSHHRHLSALIVAQAQLHNATIAEMGGMRRKDFLLAKENPLEEADDDIPDENNSDSEFESDADSEPEEVPLDEPSKKAVYNRQGIIEKLEDICWPDNVQWVHKLTIDHNEEQEGDVNDDIVRELAFYTQALEGTRQAFAKIQSLGVPFFRPPDYYAEMVKTDGLMLKVKGRLLEEKKKIEEAEERKKAREAKKTAKEVQAQKLKERSKQKKEEIESVKKWRKQRQQNGFRGGKDEDMNFDFDGEKGFEKLKKRKQGVPPGDRSGGKHGFRGQGKGKVKRERRNFKFGYGGRKGLKKQNTSETTDDLRHFNKGDLSRNKRRKG
ncbi:hypothetical protein Taro_001342, partial [Colocasia esculenta]|nr:hypothetical protein [Colocasia esculenta]